MSLTNLGCKDKKKKLINHTKFNKNEKNWKNPSSSPVHSYDWSDSILAYCKCIHDWDRVLASCSGSNANLLNLSSCSIN